MSTEYLLCAPVSFQGLIILGFWGQIPGAFQGNEICLSKHLEASFQSLGATHCVAPREVFPLSGLVLSYLQNEGLGKLKSWSPLSSDILCGWVLEQASPAESACKHHEP